MYLKQANNKKTGRTYLSMVQNYYDKDKGYSGQRRLSRLATLMN